MQRYYSRESLPPLEGEDKTGVERRKRRLNETMLELTSSWEGSHLSEAEKAKLITLQAEAQKIMDTIDTSADDAEAKLMLLEKAFHSELQTQSFYHREDPNW
ncbi:MAG: hypothetical protein UV20_C0029G0014 [Candidatus Magasanikbacteria bacterium GW2011_GWA2_42_32]|uniref:Uncharacterized protein n=1 Tax=Candidatus Magasanikbacteria bacterium GW2011_GWA2_42_32 TaxID=1619039 RepID=A0A0G1A1F5_9BACT|nr:MAG: hypothetical protein UV20_C0029G0014 [Candidatus Magasanikbacteria bacterium GW2011_GWA2_42_32]